MNKIKLGKKNPSVTKITFRGSILIIYKWLLYIDKKGITNQTEKWAKHIREQQIKIRQTLKVLTLSCSQGSTN